MPHPIGQSTGSGNASGGLPIDQLINQTSSSQPVPAQTGTGSQLGQNEFLQLLTTQLQYQDPLQPMDDTQTIAQLAQFSSLQAQNNLVTQFQSFEQNFSVLQGATLIGRNVTASAPDASGNTSTLSGTIAGMQVVNGLPQYTIKDVNGNIISDGNGNPLLITPQQLTGVSN